MNDIDRQATERVMKARSALILARRFYGVLVSNVEPVLSRAVPTMATNSRQHFYNPEFIAKLTQEQLEAVQAHESEHDARHHSTRRGHRDPRKWNEACDYAINADLLAEGFKLPDWVLFDARFRGMSAEDIYRTRELDEQRDQPQPQPEPEDEPEDDESEDENEDNGDGENEDDTQEPDEQEDEPTQGDESSDDESDGEDEGEGGSADGDEPSDDEQSEDGEGTGGDETEGEGQNGSGEADGEGDEGEPQSSGDPGMCGEVLDAADDVADNAETDHKWERITRQAASMAKAVGQLPGHISRDIERANNPGQDWREVLRAWFDQGSLQVETWNRPNRRFIGQGLYVPGKQRDGINRVAWLIDTSGSMDTVALQMGRNETQVALDDGVIDEVVVIYGDTQVNRVDTYKTGDEIEFDPRGGGGTCLRPLFEHVETLDDVSLIVCFTDMENSDWGPEPSSPVLFAATGYPDRVRQYLANAPWGAPGIDVGEH